MKTKIFSLGLALTLGLASAAFAQETTEPAEGATHGSDPADKFEGAGPLKPVAGVSYKYSVKVEPAEESTIRWIATQHVNFIKDGTLTEDIIPVEKDKLISAGNYYNNYADVAANGKDSISIKWSSKLLASTDSIFVAAHVKNGCTDNFKVYKINSVNGFMVDIMNLKNDGLGLEALGYKEPYEQCFDKIASATWTDTGMVYDYGTNILYYEVVATNFSDSWTPTFEIDGLQPDPTGTNGQTATLEWSYTAGAGAVESIDLINNKPAPATKPVEIAKDTDTSVGVSIYVKVTIRNNTYEGLSNTEIKLKVTGEDVAGNPDQLANGKGNGGDDEDSTNIAKQILKSRPTITATSGDFANSVSK